MNQIRWENRKKAIISILLSLLVLSVLMVAGCGDGGGDGSSTPSDPVPDPTPITKTLFQSGTGDVVAPTFTVTSQSNVVFEINHDGSANIIVEVKNAVGESFGLIVNEIGPYLGTSDLALPPGDYHLSVVADGNWTARITGYLEGATFDPVAGIPVDIKVTNSLPGGAKLSQGGEIEITATVRDANDDLVPDGVVINFVTDKGTVSPKVKTANGLAVATFKAGSSAGEATITASYVSSNGLIQDTTRISIENGPATSIVSSSVEPSTIGVRGSGMEDTSLITFAVRDSSGNPAIDATIVNFSLSTSINGDESLSATSAQSAGGLVTVALQSGTVSGTVAVRASVTKDDGSSLVTEARVTIVSNRPDAGRITMGATTLNLAGGVTLGLQSEVNAYIGDRAGNVVPDGWPVSFIAECGTIGTSNGFNTSTELGVASATFQTSAPTPAELIGVVEPWGRPGLCRVVAYTPGKGNFQDLNGNGIFDGSDICTSDIDEPYIDANDSGAYEAGEYYVDVNENSEHDTDVVDCVEDSMIWTSMNLMISDYAAPLVLSPSTFNLGLGNSQSFSLSLEDVLGNALVADTEIIIEADGGTLLGQTSYTMPDVVGRGGTLTFGLASAMESEPEPPQFVTITATLVPAAGDNNNGSEIFDVAAGMINLPLSDAAKPSVSLITGVPVGTQLTQSEEITLTAFVFTAEGDPAEDGTLVNFSSSNGLLTPTSAVTVDGAAKAVFTAPNFGGLVSLSASALGVNGSTDIEISAGDASTIVVSSVVPTQIGVRGSGLVDTSIIVFDVLDQVGNPAVDGTLVTFERTAFTGGGERLSSTSAQSINGQVQVVLQSGIRSGTVEIAAILDNNSGSSVTTTARVVIAAGLPDAKHFSLAADPLNIPGFVRYNEQSLITAFLADRYSNPVPLATPIFFESEAGAMVLEDLISFLGNNETNIAGQAYATHISQAPVPDLATGLSTILAWTLGSESFVDLNGNGSYDSGEPYTDLGEPFIDANGNGEYDAATTTREEERYVDLNENGSYEDGNDKWDGQTFVWTSVDVLWSAATAKPIIKPDTFVIAENESQTFDITVVDDNGNPLPAGTTIATNFNCTYIDVPFDLEGDVNVVVPDATSGGVGRTEFSVDLYSRTQSPRDQNCTLSVEVSAPVNGSATASIQGTLRQREVPPVAVDDSITAQQDTLYSSGSFEKLIRNDTDANDDVLTAVPGNIVTNAGGSLVLAADGGFTYNPPAGFVGTDFADYVVTDGTGRTDTGTLNITVE